MRASAIQSRIGRTPRVQVLTGSVLANNQEKA